MLKNLQNLSHAVDEFMVLKWNPESKQSYRVLTQQHISYNSLSSTRNDSFSSPVADRLDIDW